MVAEAIQQAQEIPFATKHLYLYEEAEEMAPAEVVEVTEDLFTVSGSFIESLQEVARAASADPSRPVLNAVLVETTGEGLRLVATDTYRLWVRDGVQAEAVDFQGSVLIPLEFLKKEWPAFVKANGGKRRFPSYAKLHFSRVVETTVKTCKRIEQIGVPSGGFSYRTTYRTVVHEDLVRVKGREVETVTVTVETREPLQVSFFATVGQFVSYGKVTPKAENAKAVVEVAAGKLAEVLEFCGGVADEDASRIILGIDTEGTLTVRAGYYNQLIHGRAEAEAKLEGLMNGAVLDGDTFEIGLNWRYLVDFLNGVHGCVTLRYFGQLSCFTVTNGKDLYVQMPMQIFDALGNVVSTEA